jgi:hypothetical protein
MAGSRRRVPSLLLVTASLVAVVGLVAWNGAIRATASRSALSGADRPANPAVPSSKLISPRGPGEVRSLAPGESFVPGVGAHWISADKSAATSISEAAAISIVADGGYVQAFNAPNSPSANLAVFSNDVKGTLNDDGSVVLDDQNVLAWIVQYSYVPSVVHGPGVFPSSDPPPTKTSAHACDLFVVVDATSGHVREVFQSCDRQIG